MPVIDYSEEVDIDIGIPTEEEQNLHQEEKSKAIPNPIFDEMEEDDSDDELDLQEKPVFDPKREEKEFYETLSDVEKEAWNRGWRKGKFFKGRYKDGTPKARKTAEEFLAIQERETPVLNERNRKLTKEKTVLENEVSELRKQMQVMLNVQKIAQEREFTQSHSSLDRAEENAILEGDVEKVRSIRKQRDDLEKSKVVFEEPESAPVEQPRIPKEEVETFKDWSADNTWFYEDKMMKSYAESYFDTLSNHLPLSKKLEMVSEEVEKRFRDKIGISKPPRVESGQRGTQTRRVQSSYNDLPADVRKNCDFMAKRHNFTKDQVARMQQEAIKEYFN